MKTIKLFAALVAALTITATASAKTSVKFHEDDAHHQYRITCTYDKQGRLQTKVIDYLNANDCWTHKCAYSYFYGEDENTVTYAAWDAKTRTYTRNAKQQKFQLQSQDTQLYTLK